MEKKKSEISVGNHSVGSEEIEQINEEVKEQMPVGSGRAYNFDSRNFSKVKEAL